ncbi:MAG: hypothetical protein PWP15_1171 [Methanothermococcus sp.]|jgi:ABC-type glutathione transport system ATPase component|uniref:DUF2666 domain-containing protein n=1 Tax=Methanothermococcus TaxID=155862 RepID=UPI000361C511|nr:MULTISPECIES: DUF2666 domain-containing protein [Methanothermococcus]MDK2790664.1 hypothetical protein [Methanothermococcus sp.]MDK2987578.1 hypothetical protein [Methanothermococcus sp.]
MQEEKIQFMAKKGKWFVVKKMNIDEKTEDIEIARLLAAINETTHNKIGQFLPFDMKALEEIADEIYTKKKGRIKEDELANVLMKLKSPSTTRKLNNITKSKEGKEILKIILNNIILERLGIKTRVDAKLIEKYIEKEEN